MLKRIVSGGQTGVDRAALDAAVELGIAHGGWCPRGRLAEDGRIAEHYALTEMESRRYADRTERNVVDSDATLILCRGPLTGGTRLTGQFAIRYARPYLVVSLDGLLDAETIRDWIHRSAKTLNVAGPRESSAPGIHREAKAFLVNVLKTSMRTAKTRRSKAVSKVPSPTG